MFDEMGSSAALPIRFSIPIDLEPRGFQIPEDMIGEVLPVSIRELKRLTLDLLERPSDQRLFRSSLLLHGIQHGSHFGEDNLGGNALRLALFKLAIAAFDLFQDEPFDFRVVFNTFEECVSQLDGLIGGQSL